MSGQVPPFATDRVGGPERLPTTGPAGLAEMQRAFAAWLRLPAAGPPGELLAQLAGPSTQLSERLAVYRCSSRHVQRAALAAAFPVLCALTGAELFAALCEDHLTDPGSRSGDLHLLGAGMAATVAAEPACAAYPFLRDVARLEWAIHRSQFVTQSDQTPCVDPATVPPGELHRLRAVTAAGLALLVLATPAARIWRAHQPGTSEALRDINPAGGPEWVAVRRAEAGVYLHALSPAEFDLLEACQAGLTLAQALDRLAAKAPEPARLPPGQGEPAPDLAAWLPRWLASGLVRGLALSPG